MNTYGLNLIKLLFALYLSIFLLGCATEGYEKYKPNESKIPSGETSCRLNKPIISVARNYDEWSDLWSEINCAHYNMIFVPQVELKNKFVLVAALGVSNPRNEVIIDRIKVSNGKLIVEVLMKLTGSGCISIPEAYSTPTAISVIEKTDMEIEFRVQKKFIDCM